MYLPLISKKKAVDKGQQLPKKILRNSNQKQQRQKQRSKTTPAKEQTKKLHKKLKKLKITLQQTTHHSLTQKTRNNR